MKRRLLIFLVALAAAFGAPGYAHATGANDAIAINTKDDSSLFKFAWAVRHVLGDVVDEQNGAVAYASCTSCQTTAVAIEIVLVENSSPSTFTPQNVAIAVNEGCTLCDTFAAAYQFVIQTAGPVRFTSTGLRELLEIRQEIKDWGRQGLSNAEIRARLPALIQRLQQVLANELVAVKNAPPAQDQNEGETSERGPPATPTTGATTEGGASTTTEMPATTETGPSTTTAPTTTGTTSTTP